MPCRCNVCCPDSEENAGRRWSYLAHYFVLGVGTTGTTTLVIAAHYLPDVSAVRFYFICELYVTNHASLFPFHHQSLNLLQITSTVAGIIFIYCGIYPLYSFRMWTLIICSKLRSNVMIR